MTWLDDLNSYLKTINPPAAPPPSSGEDEGPNPIPDNPTPEDCRGGSVFRNNNDCSSSFSDFNVVTFDSTGIQWVQNYPELCACLSTSDGPYPSPYDPVKSVPYALRVQAYPDAGRNNDWIGYYISTGNAVLVDIRRAHKYGMYNWLCPSSTQKALSFLVTKEPDVVYEQCKLGGQYAILGIYWPLYQAAQQRAGGLYGMGAFAPAMPNVPAIVVPMLPSWFGTIPMPKIPQVWSAMVIPGYTKPTEQEVQAAKQKQSSVGIGTVAAVAAGVVALALIVWKLKN
ncbi:MAG: hypothetical protein PHC68_04180 [Syntrophorhabdaceae bacterium]|nr:hypothetical protein [Syntrophorhabdaceae bacterium]